MAQSPLSRERYKGEPTYDIHVVAAILLFIIQDVNQFV